MTIEQISSAALQNAMKERRVVLVDVREPDEYREAYIADAVLIPMNFCHPASLPCNPDKMLVFQCRSGGRSQRVCELYHAAYPDRMVYNLEGGIIEWSEQGYPVCRMAGGDK